MYLSIINFKKLPKTLKAVISNSNPWKGPKDDQIIPFLEIQKMQPEGRIFITLVLMGRIINDVTL